MIYHVHFKLQTNIGYMTILKLLTYARFLTFHSWSLSYLATLLPCILIFPSAQYSPAEDLVLSKYNLIF